MTLHPLPHVGAIPPYPPGRPIEAVAREFGLDPASIVKLASNENPLGCSPAATRAIAELAAAPNIYPDFDCHTLRHTIADFNGIGADHVLPAAGSSEVIALVGQAFLAPGLNSVIPRYAFQAYAQFTKAYGGEPRIVPTRGWDTDIDAMLAAIDEQTRLLFLASPNNPTGVGMPPAAIARMVEETPPHVLLILDEAYREFLDPADQPDSIALLSRRKNLLVMRTFSKIHGLAGLRVGYALGDPALLQILRRLQLPFSVSSVAQAAAVAALGDDAFVELGRRENMIQRRMVEQALDARGLERVPSLGNFILFRAGDGAAVARALMARGVIVRPVANYGLGEWLRVSIGTERENRIFLDALDAVRATEVAA